MTATIDRPEKNVTAPTEESAGLLRHPARRGSGTFVTSTIVLGVVNVLLLAAGVASSFWFFGANIGIAGLSVALPAAGLCTFLVLFTDHRDIRTAVMGTFTVLYLGFVSATFNTEFVAIMDDRDGIGRHVYDSFNTFMLVMLGFYFSGKAVEMVAKTRTTASETDDRAPVDNARKPGKQKRDRTEAPSS
jgi:hypothetical protein